MSARNAGEPDTSARPALPPDPPGASDSPFFRDGQLEALKWVALASMMLDHVGRLALGQGTDTWVFAGGRLAFPLFALVLAVNLARTGDRAERAARTALRLGLWCAVSIAPSIWARGEPQLVNVLGTLGLGAVLCAALAGGSPQQQPLAGRRLARAQPATRPLGPAARLLMALAALLAAPHVEFGVAGVLLVAAVFLAATDRPVVGSAVALLCLAQTGLLNGEAGGWTAFATTVAAVPAAWVAQRLPLTVPRVGRAFYVVYPAHLALIGAWRTLA